MRLIGTDAPGVRWAKGYSAPTVSPAMWERPAPMYATNIATTSAKAISVWLVIKGGQLINTGSMV